MGRRGHIAVGGSSGRGKTNWGVWYLNQQAELGERGICALFPHREAGEQWLLHLEDRFLLDRVKVFDTKDARRVLPKRLIWTSSNPFQFQRDIENEEYAYHLISLAGRTRKDIKDVRERSAIFRNSMLAVQVYMNLDTSGLWMPPFAIPRILVKGSDEQKWAIRNCKHERLRVELAEVSAMPLHEQMAKVVPAADFLNGFLNTALMRAICSVPPSFVLAEHLKECETGEPGIYVGLGGGSDDAIALHFGSDFQQIVQDAKANPCDVRRLVLVDEIFNYNLFDVTEARALATIRGFNVDYVGLFQTYSHPDRSVTQSLRSATDKVLFGNDDFEAATEFAKDIARGLDEYKVHHTDETTKQRTRHRREEKVTEGTHTSADGKTGKSKNVSEVLVPEIEEYVEKKDVYQQGQEQLFWLAQRVTEQKVGEAWFQFGSEKPYLGVVPLVPPICDPEDFPTEAKRCLSDLKAQPPYQEPRPFTMPPQPDEEKPTQPRGQSGKQSGGKPKVRGQKPAG